MNGKTLLVLGASRYQLPTIEYAKSQGMRVIVTDNVAENPGHKIADKSYLVDTTDHREILNIVKQEGVGAAIAPCTDVAVTTAAHVNQQLGASSVSVVAAQTLTSKIKFREFQKQHNLPCPKFEIINSELLVANDLDFENKWIIKPDQSSGSKGIFIVESSDELIERYPASRDMSLNNKVAVEQFIDGYQGTVEGVVKDGKIELLFFLDRQTALPPYVCTKGHRTPSKLDKVTKDKILEAVENLLALLAIDSTVFDVDFIWDGEQVFILEASPRLGGNSITELLKLAYDINFLELAVCIAFAQTTDSQYVETAQPTSVILLGVDQDGILSIDEKILEHLQSTPWITSSQLHTKVGEKVAAFTNGRHCLMTIFITADSYDLLVEREAYIRSLKLLRSV